MDPFFAAISLFQNRKHIKNTLKWLQGDQFAFETSEQKIEKLKAAFEELAEIQRSQDEWFVNFQKVLVRLWIALGIVLILALVSLGINIYFLTSE